MKGKLPPSELIVLESEESQWRILTNGLINEFKTTALIEKEPKVKVRVQLVITKIIPPEGLRGESVCRTTAANQLKKLTVGISRASEFLMNYLDKRVWMFVGYIDGENKIPVLIMYYQVINLAVYTQKLAQDTHEEFFPSGSPSLN